MTAAISHAPFQITMNYELKCSNDRFSCSAFLISISYVTGEKKTLTKVWFLDKH